MQRIFLLEWRIFYMARNKRMHVRHVSIGSESQDSGNESVASSALSVDWYDNGNETTESNTESNRVTSDQYFSDESSGLSEDNSLDWHKRMLNDIQGQEEEDREAEDFNETIILHTEELRELVEVDLSSDEEPEDANDDVYVDPYPDPSPAEVAEIDAAIEEAFYQRQQHAYKMKLHQLDVLVAEFEQTEAALFQQLKDAYRTFSLNREQLERGMLGFSPAPNVWEFNAELDQNQRSYDQACRQLTQVKRKAQLEYEAAHQLARQQVEDDPCYKAALQYIEDSVKEDKSESLQIEAEYHDVLNQESAAILEEHYNREQQRENKKLAAQQERDLAAEAGREMEGTTKCVYKRFNDHTPAPRPKDDVYYGRKATQKKEGIAGQFGSRQNMRYSLVNSELYLNGLVKNQKNAAAALAHQDDEANQYTVRKYK
jgi:hypothetical protein